jgi:nifR3 family TIM-barrel protein
VTSEETREFLRSPLTLRAERPVTLRNRLLLAPMEGITERCFRDLVITIGGVGGACTEFIRISQAPVPIKVVRKYLGPILATPVGVQFMAPDAEHLSASIAAAEQAGAVYIDLNFGCPAPVVFDKCAGSALLCKPEAIARIVASARASTPLPVSAKVRAGIDGPSQLDEIVRAVSEAGAAMLTLHARLRVHSYAHPANHDWIAQAKQTLRAAGSDMPLIGNGGVSVAADAAALIARTGCDGVMIGRAALADPWIFTEAAGGSGPSVAQAAQFALDYAERLRACYGERTALARLKQLIKYYRAGGISTALAHERERLLRLNDLREVCAWFVGIGERDAQGIS